MDTDSFEEQLREGEERLARGQAAEAVSCLQRCVELRPDDARARLSLGQALSESGRDAEALCRRLFANYPLGVQLLREKSGMSHLELDQRAVDEPDSELDRMIKENYRV